MNYYRLQLAFVIVMLFAGSGHAQSAITNGDRFVVVVPQHTNAVVPWQPNTRLLDLPAKKHYSIDQFDSTKFAHDVEQFYLALRDKKWRDTYEGRAKAFREDCLLSDYLAEAINNENKWGLANYEVLSIKLCNSGPTNGIDEAVLICKFTEIPGYVDSYSTVFWHWEEGSWKCLSAGPTKLEIFGARRPPMIDWQ